VIQARVKELENFIETLQRKLESQVKQTSRGGNFESQEDLKKESLRTEGKRPFSLTLSEE